jgi:hypothetical protein
MMPPSSRLICVQESVALYGEMAKKEEGRE